MADTLDKVIDAAKKLRKYAKKSSDAAFVNLIADINMQLADLRVELAGGRETQDEGTTTPSASSTQKAAPSPMSPASQVGSNFDSIFDRDSN